MFLSASLKRGGMLLGVTAVICFTSGIAIAQSEGADDSASNESPWHEGLQITTRVGTESWHIEYAGVKANSAEKDALRMPDGAVRWPYRDVSPWVTVHASYELNQQVQFLGKFQANQGFGGRIDELAVNYAISPLLGVRAGVVDYKLSWCKDYEANNPWIQDPNQFCSDFQNKRMTAAGPGLQTYLNLPIANYQVQTLVGIYSPKVFSFDDTENGRNGNPFDQHTDKNDKFGLALNVLNLSNGAELRASWLYTDLQITVDPVLYPSEFGPVENQIDHTFYLAVEKPVTPRLSAGVYLTRSLKTTDLRYLSFNGLKYETWTNLSGITAEIGYRLASSDRLFFALSQFEAIKRYTAIWYDGAYITPEEENTYFYNTAAALSWQKSWSRRLSTTVQLKRVVLSYKNLDAPQRISSSNALGFRLAYTF